jgi:hypothetical protein
MMGLWFSKFHGKQKVKKSEEVGEAWTCGSIAGPMLSMHKTIGLIPAVLKQNKTKQKQQSYLPLKYLLLNSCNIFWNIDFLPVFMDYCGHS